MFRAMFDVRTNDEEHPVDPSLGLRQPPLGSSAARGQSNANGSRDQLETAPPDAYVVQSGPAGMQPIAHARTSALRAIRIEAVDLTRTVHAGGLFGLGTKTLLDHVSLSIPPGAFVALVGASGTGKTTLLNALSGQAGVQQGQVLFNRKDLHTHFDEFNEAIGYVPQDDIIHLRLTVERALYYAARLRLPDRLHRAQIWQRVDEVLEDTEMVPQRRQMISALSGGQRKRVSIGVELLAKPAVFFLDEPTSGLDPGLASRLMRLLRRLADRGHTIVLSTHTTSDVRICDYVCFLAPGGRLAYFGTVDGLTQQFQTSDYAQIYNALRTEPDRWVGLFQHSYAHQQYVEAPVREARAQMRETQIVPASMEVGASGGSGGRGSTGDAVGAAVAGGATRLGASVRVKRQSTPRKRSTPLRYSVRQWCWLTERYVDIFWHDRINLAILLAQAPIIAALVVLLARHNVLHEMVAQPNIRPPLDIDAQRAIFIMTASAAWFGIINAAREIVKERSVYRRERAVHLSILPYLLSKMAVLSVLLAVQSFLLLYITGLRVGYPPNGLIFRGTSGAFAELYITLLLVAAAGLALGLAISAVAPNADRALSFVPIALLPQIILADVVFTLDRTWGKIISWFMPTRWGVEAMGSTELVRNKFSDHSGLTFYVHNVWHLMMYWAVLLALMLLFFLVAALALRRGDVQHGR